VTEPAPSHTAFSRRATIQILAGLMFGMFLSALDQTIVAAALPAIASDLRGIELLPWLISAYLLTSTASTPIYGKLSDLYGRRPLLQIAIVIFLVASALCALASNMAELIFFRALQGIGGAGLMSMAHAVIADVISPRDRGRYQIYIASSFTIASVLGPIIGGLFVDYLTWHWIFIVNVPIAGIGLYVSHRTLKQLVPRRVRHRIDYLGAFLIVGAITGVILVMTIGGREAGWDSALVIGLAGATGVLFAICVVQQRATREAILPPRLFTNVFVAANAINILMSAIAFGLLVLIPLYLQLVFRLSASEAGVILIPLMAAGTIGAIIAGRITAVTGRYKFLPIVGMILQVVGVLLLARSDGATDPWVICAFIAICGFGSGLIGPTTMVAVQNNVDARDLGAATASISFFRSMGGALGVPLVSTVLVASLDSVLRSVPGHEALGPDVGLAAVKAGPGLVQLFPAASHAAVRDAATLAFHDAFLATAGLAILAVVAALLLREVPLRSTPGYQPPPKS
jgi:EmrB/QacA subfamily drug resistance transporter